MLFVSSEEARASWKSWNPSPNVNARLIISHPLFRVAFQILSLPRQDWIALTAKSNGCFDCVGIIVVRVASVTLARIVTIVGWNFHCFTISIYLESLFRGTLQIQFHKLISNLSRTAMTKAAATATETGSACWTTRSKSSFLMLRGLTSRVLANSKEGTRAKIVSNG